MLTLEKLGEICCVEESVVTIIVTCYTTEASIQSLRFVIEGAQDYNVLCSVIETMENSEAEYYKFEYDIV